MTIDEIVNEKIVQSIKSTINNSIQSVKPEDGKPSRITNYIAMDTEPSSGKIFRDDKQKVDYFFGKIIDIDYLPERIRPIGDTLSDLFPSVNDRFLDIYRHNADRAQINTLKPVLDRLTKITKMSNTIMFYNYKNEPGRLEMENTCDYINKKLDAILPKQLLHGRSINIMREFGNLFDHSKIDQVETEIAAYFLKQNIEFEGLESKESVKEVITSLRDKYELELEIMPGVIKEARELVSTGNIKDILQEICKEYEPAEEIEEKSEEIDIPSYIRELQLDETRKRFENARLKKELDLKKDELLGDSESDFLNIINTDEYTNHVLQRNEIIPAMNNLQDESINHILGNNINRRIKNKMGKRFERINDAINPKENLDSEEYLDRLVKSKTKISEKNTAPKRFIAGLVKPVFPSAAYSLRHKPVEFKEGEKLTLDETIAKEGYSTITSDESFKQKYKFDYKPEEPKKIEEPVKEDSETLEKPVSGYNRKPEPSKQQEPKIVKEEPKPEPEPVEEAPIKSETSQKKREPIYDDSNIKSLYQKIWKFRDDVSKYYFLPEFKNTSIPNRVREIVDKVFKYVQPGDTKNVPQIENNLNHLYQIIQTKFQENDANQILTELNKISDFLDNREKLMFNPEEYQGFERENYSTTDFGFDKVRKLIEERTKAAYENIDKMVAKWSA